MSSSGRVGSGDGGPSKRERLIEGALDQIHKRGYAATTLAKVAEASGVPLGNVYYYFKTKDELVQAVVKQHLARVEEIIQQADGQATPLSRILCLLELIESQADEVARHGCPMGCLNQELEKAGGRFEGQAEALFLKQLDWLEQQFLAAGRGDQEARSLAVHVLASVQGASLLCQSMRDTRILGRELGYLREWVSAQLDPVIETRR